MKYPQWIKQFAIDSGLNQKDTLVHVHHERDEIPADPATGLRGGWELNGRTIYSLKDGYHEYEIVVHRLNGPDSQSLS